jgi:hypothetical protein
MTNANIYLRCAHHDPHLHGPFSLGIESARIVPVRQEDETRNVWMVKFNCGCVAEEPVTLPPPLPSISVRAAMVRVRDYWREEYEPDGKREGAEIVLSLELLDRFIEWIEGDEE